MLTRFHKYLLVLSTSFLVSSTLGMLPAQSQSLAGGVNRNQQLNATQRFFGLHPKVRKTTISTGVGTATGALTGLISGKGVFRGAAIGAGTGAGVGLVSSSELLNKHPIVKDTAVGTISGAGIALSSSKRGKVKNMTKGAGVGAAMGMALGFLRTGLR